ncbi:hypothetical protein Pint_32904 [Pistacia integerrima]|uniref:Uncharacterized protein n=1 Tax=Pistacia integerrima TaxID=434235 RepID=A0ACC0X4P8_9ROSI|nr:hypothetical protein Pint_32904 [Pistacia integerrima]
MDEDGLSNTNREIFPAQGLTLPILQKIICLCNKIQDLKRDHSSLSDQVKNMNTDCFPGPGVLDNLQNLSNEYELLKKKYIDESSERK